MLPIPNDFCNEFLFIFWISIKLELANNKGGISSRLSNFFSSQNKSLSATYNAIMDDFQGLDHNLSSMIELLEDESKRITAYFDRGLVFEEITHIKEFEGLCINYQKEKVRLYDALNAQGLHFEDLQYEHVGILNDISAVREEYFTNAASRFVVFYSDVYSRILDKGDKNTIFFSLVQCLRYLEAYIRQSETMTQNYARSFMGAVANTRPDRNSYRFIEYDGRKVNERSF